MNKSVLLVAVDDCPTLLELKRHLDTNYSVFSVLSKHSSTRSPDVQQLANLIKQTEFALICFEFSPDSLNLIKQLKCLVNFSAAVIAVIAPELSAFKAQLVAIGVDDFLTTPINYQQLAELLDVWQVQPKNTTAMTHIERVLHMSRGDKQLATFIFTKLFADIPKQLIEIKTALAMQDYQVAERVAHNVNGSFAVCGLVDLKASAEQLENYLIEKDFVSSQLYFSTLQETIGSFIDLQTDIMAYFKT